MLQHYVVQASPLNSVRNPGTAAFMTWRPHILSLLERKQFFRPFPRTWALSSQVLHGVEVHDFGELRQCGGGTRLAGCQDEAGRRGVVWRLVEKA